MNVGPKTFNFEKTLLRLLLLDLMLNAHANSNITCTQTMCPINRGPGDTVDETHTFPCLFFHRNNDNDVSTKELFVEVLLLDSSLNAMTVDMVDNLESVTKIYVKGVKIYLEA